MGHDRSGCKLSPFAFERLTGLCALERAHVRVATISGRRIMKIGDLVRSRHMPRFTGIITQMLLDGKHVRVLWRGKFSIVKMNELERV